MYEQFDSCKIVSDVKITSSALRGGKLNYIIFHGAKFLEIDVIKVVSKTRKVNQI